MITIHGLVSQVECDVIDITTAGSEHRYVGGRGEPAERSVPTGTGQIVTNRSIQCCRRHLDAATRHIQEAARHG